LGGRFGDVRGHADAIRHTVKRVCLIAARNGSATIASTVTAIKGSVDEVIVVDDGSADQTADEAIMAGARVLRSTAHRGKGSALEGALTRLAPADVYLFADADLGASAEGLGALVDTVISGEADMAIAVFPPGQGGGFGLVKRTATAAVRALSGFRPREPLSGQRALSWRCLEACRPLAGGYGVETAMLIDASRAGMRIVEMDLPWLTHRATSRDIHGFAHRARQGVDITLAVLRRVAAGRRRRP
jgi:glycosyltransferase involved in cell wall biosynthesis